LSRKLFDFEVKGFSSLDCEDCDTSESFCFESSGLTSGESPLERPGVVVDVAVVEMVGGEVERRGSRGGQHGQGKPDKPEKYS